MSLPWVRSLLPVVAALVLAAPLAAQTRTTTAAPPAPFIPGPWWHDFQKNLGLTGEQSVHLDEVWQKWRVAARQKRDELDASENELSRLIESEADEASVARQADRVEATRAVLNKSRTLMLVRMRQLLSPDQRQKLKVLREQWDKDHPAPPRVRDTTPNK